MYICNRFKSTQRKTLGFLAVGLRGHLIGGNSVVVVTLSLISDPGASLRSRGSWSYYRQSDLNPVTTVEAQVDQRCLCILGLDSEPLRFGWMGLD